MIIAGRSLQAGQKSPALPRATSLSMAYGLFVNQWMDGRLLVSLWTDPRSYLRFTCFEKLMSPQLVV